MRRKSNDIFDDWIIHVNPMTLKARTATVKYSKLKKGTYKLTVKVKAAGNSSYRPLTKKVILKVKVRS